MLANFHTHSKFCDGKGELAQYAARAKELRMVSLGFSSHAPLPFDCQWCMKKDDLPVYHDSIERVKQDYPEVEIYKSLEIDFIPGVVSPNQFKGQLDYTLGSVHFVERLPDGTPWEIDGPHTAFLEGYEKIFRRNIKDLIARYYSLTREMIDHSCPTLVGHLDKIKIQNIDDKLFHESDPWYREEIKKTLQVIEGQGCIVEVNTRGLYQKKSSTPYPSPWILERIREKNIPITISSDAHHPDDLINQFPETIALLHSLGFKKITILHEGSWQPYPFTKHGINFY